MECTKEQINGLIKNKKLEKHNPTVKIPKELRELINNRKINELVYYLYVAFRIISNERESFMDYGYNNIKKLYAVSMREYYTSLNKLIKLGFVEKVDNRIRFVKPNNVEQSINIFIHTPQPKYIIKQEEPIKDDKVYTFIL